MSGIIIDDDEDNSTLLEWEISAFLPFIEKPSIDYFKSKPFSFEGSLWHLKLWCKEDQDKKLSLIFMIYNNELRSYSVEYYFGIKKLDDNFEDVGRGVLNGRDASNKYGQTKLAVSKVKKRKLQLVPSGVITIICRLKRLPPSSNSLSILTSETSVSKSDEVLSEVYKKVLLEGQNHDLILKIGDVELPAHRDILRARSRVFESMLSHNMKEKNTGVIDIPDCDPHAMKQFLLYVYCGKVDTLNDDNMLGLYYAADKYEMEQLKKECSDVINNSLSVTNIYQVITLALNHNDSDLLEHSTNFFCNNIKNILRTVEWQDFMKVNSTVANELLIKSMDMIIKDH